MQIFEVVVNSNVTNTLLLKNMKVKLMKRLLFEKCMNNLAKLGGGGGGCHS